MNSGFVGALLDIFLLQQAREVGALEAEEFSRFRLVPVAAALILFKSGGTHYEPAIRFTTQSKM